MIQLFKNWWNKARPYRAWAIRKNSTYDRLWGKVVSNSYFKPCKFNFEYAGPFRSEVDCDEFCDHQNVGIIHGDVLMYGRQNAENVCGYEEEFDEDDSQSDY